MALSSSHSIPIVKQNPNQSYSNLDLEELKYGIYD